jgi:hypothetical protein
MFRCTAEPNDAVPSGTRSIPVDGSASNDVHRMVETEDTTTCDGPTEPNRISKGRQIHNDKPFVAPTGSRHGTDNEKLKYTQYSVDKIDSRVHTIPVHHPPVRRREQTKTQTPPPRVTEIEYHPNCVLFPKPPNTAASPLLSPLVCPVHPWAKVSVFQLMLLCLFDEKKTQSMFFPSQVRDKAAWLNFVRAQW